MSAPAGGRAQLARSLATALRVGPLAAGSFSMGPLAARGGYRGGPEAQRGDPRSTEHVCVGFAAVVSEPERPLAVLLGALGPLHRALRTLEDAGCALSPLELASLTALRAGGASDPSALCAQLNEAASERVAHTWSCAQLDAALARLETLGLVERDGAGWRATLS